jgi:hypothetical protein
MQRAFTSKDVSAESWALDVDLVGARVEPPEAVVSHAPVPVA